MPNQKARSTPADPERIKLTEIQAQRLGALSDVAAKDLVDLTVADIREKFRLRIDPSLFLFRRVCGTVVKKDPATGVEYPVPYATVHVEDTDCHLLGYFPGASKWGWYFPFHCHREVIATAKADECGRFCVWIPRWDIDWILRWRHERICFPIVFERPSIRDLLDDLIPPPIPNPRPGPGPDPGPFSRIDRGLLIKQVEDGLGRDVARELELLDGQATFGRRNVDLTALLDSPVLERQVPPPLPKELLDQCGERRGHESAEPAHAVRASLAARLKIDARELARLDLRHYIGPFKRCIDIFVPEWAPILDVPDITFRVTQDTDGNGVEETIYAEGYFQVRWEAPVLGPLKIKAWPNARAVPICDDVEVPCGNVPAIVLAGRMPVVADPTIYDTANGYAVRPNRPHPSGLFADPLPNPAGASPFTGAVALYGCNRTNPTATHYRVLYKYSPDGGVTFTPFTPFVGLTWPLVRLLGLVLDWLWPVSDAHGWYPILPSGPNPYLPQDLVLDWPTYSFANGRYVLKVELGTGGTNPVIASSAEVAFNVDNSSPLGALTVEWRKVGGGAFQKLMVAPCPIVARGSVPADVEFRVTLDASAAHLRSANMGAGGCGGFAPALVSGTEQHWHVTPAENTTTLQALYRLSASAPQGSYSFSGTVSSRAFNPSGGDGGHLLVPPWEYDPAPNSIYPGFTFAVFNID